MARAVVFVGPSLPGVEVSAAIDLRTPAKRGDVSNVIAAGTRFIGLIDGILIGDLAVTPAELREGHASGTRIYGAASLGALRAVECPTAVHGIGEVYELFRDGVLTDDDELVGTFDEHYRYVAFPSIIVRDRCAQAVRAGMLSHDDANTIVELIRELPFYDRTVGGMRKTLIRHLDTPRVEVFERWLADTSDDIKARDARRLIEILEERLGS